MDQSTISHSFHFFLIAPIRKARRKDKDPNPAQQEETKQYLHAAMLESTTPEVKLREIVNLVEGLDYNEWLASHSKLRTFPNSLSI